MLNLIIKQFFSRRWEFALSLFTKRVTRANHSRHSLQKKQQERIAPNPPKKIATRANRSRRSLQKERLEQIVLIVLFKRVTRAK